MSKKHITCPICGCNKVKSSFFGYYICPLCDSKFKYLEKPAQSILDSSMIYNNSIQNVVEIYNIIDDDEISGTGILINKNGFVLTSAHIFTKITPNNNITNFNENIFIRKNTNSTSLRTKVISIDESIDLALLKIEDMTNNSYTIFSNEKLVVGQHIFVIGNSKGEGLCMVDGMISDNHRYIGNRTLFMISAPVTAGCSGAPVLNQKGELIGMIVGGREGTTAMNYAVPINVIKSFLHPSIFRL